MGWFAVKKVKSDERLIVLRLGRLLEPKGPGHSVVLPLLDQWQLVDLSDRTFSVPLQHVFTADGGVVALGCEVFFKVKKPVLAITKIQNFESSTNALAQTALMKEICRYDTHEVASKYAYITEALTLNLNNQTLAWGVEISRVVLPALTVIVEPPEKKPHILPGNIDLSVLGQHMLKMAVGAAASKDDAAPSDGDQGRVSFDNIGAAMAAVINGVGLPMNNQQPAAGANDTGEVNAETRNKDSILNSVDQLLSKVKSALQTNESLRRDLDGSFEFRLLLADDPVGAAPLLYHICLQPELSVGRGASPFGQTADASLSLSVEDLRAMLTGELTSFQAFMSGRVTVTGDTSAAMRLRVLSHVIKSGI